MKTRYKILIISIVIITILFLIFLSLPSIHKPTGNPNECWYEDDDGNVVPCRVDLDSYFNGYVITCDSNIFGNLDSCIALDEDGNVIAKKTGVSDWVIVYTFSNPDGIVSWTGTPEGMETKSPSQSRTLLPYTENYNVPFDYKGRIDYDALIKKLLPSLWHDKLQSIGVDVKTSHMVLLRGAQVSMYQESSYQCGYVIDDDKEVYWLEGRLDKSKIYDVEVFSENPMPCTPNMGSCWCDAQTLAEEQLPNFEKILLLIDKCTEYKGIWISSESRCMITSKPFNP